MDDENPIATIPDDPEARLVRAAELVAGHPWVARAEPAPGGRLRVTPDPAAISATPTPGPLLREHLEHWAEVYDWVYGTGEGRHADDLDLSGWRDSVTGAPLPREHMREWIDRTVELVLESNPRTVLEAGCGTGLLAHRLHGSLEGYVGTDVADIAVDRLSAAGLPRTGFVRAAAHEVDSPTVRRVTDAVLGPGVRPDCVVLNSVTQCFPNLDYLAAVVRGALAVVADGGTVVLGDIRHSALVERHFTELERTRDPQAPLEGIAERVRVAIAEDEELSFAPEAVREIVAASGRAVRISTRARTMAAATELTRYRYDLVLHIGDRAGPPVEYIPWSGPELLSEKARTAHAGAPVVVHGIPNGLVDETPDTPTPYALRAALAGIDAAVLVDGGDPRLLAVAVPASAAPAAQRVAAPAPGPAAGEPFPAFLRRRLAELLRDHLRRVAPGLPLPPLDLAGRPSREAV
ncbi:class I SAM-dependent methyltransferase [Streptomyces sp. ST2-7A]|uniref:class I SAM-dependent methyltransferase n=1 Tax=Streptomyces sp. ST2-7A TaxID=2907214 RepID=UPI0027E2BDCB|nr:class I SAM-dependent methyltransferase [Streptomyces sp. ST2-7A]